MPLDQSVMKFRLRPDLEGGGMEQHNVDGAAIQVLPLACSMSALITVEDLPEEVRGYLPDLTPER